MEVARPFLSMGRERERERERETEREGERERKRQRERAREKQRVGNRWPGLSFSMGSDAVMLSKERVTGGQAFS